MVACDSGRYIAEKIDAELKGSPGYRGILNYDQGNKPDSEMDPSINKFVRGNHVYVVQSCYDPLSKKSINDNMMAMLLTIQAARKAAARGVTALTPYYPYGRGDRRHGKEEGMRTSIGARLVADFIYVAGASDLMTMDFHNEAIEAFFPNTFPVDNLYATNILISAINEYYPEFYKNAKNSSFDVGGVKRIRVHSKRTKRPFVVVDKARDPITGKLIQSMLIGDVKGYDVIGVDDLVGGGDTVVEGIEVLVANGARDIIAACTFPMFVGNAAEKFDALHEQGKLAGFIGTDAIWHGDELPEQHKWFKYAQIAPTIAKAIVAAQNDSSVQQALEQD